MKQERVIFIMIFFASLASLAYELALVRIFSISLWYHFAFMVISVAMLGIGASGSVLSLWPTMRDIRLVPWCSLLLGITIPLSYLIANSIPFDPARISWDWMQLFSIGLYSLVLSMPFFCFGLMVSITYSNLSHASSRIYAADMIGAATGSLLTLWLMYGRGPEQAVFMVAILPLLTLLVSAKKTIKLLSLVFIALNCAVLFTNPQVAHPRISPYKPLSLALQFPGAKHLQTYYSPYSRVDVFQSPAVRFAPGLSLRYLENLPEQTGVAVDAGGISAMTDERNRNRLAFIDYLPASLPYALSPKQDVLLLEPGGGLPVLIAKYHGAVNVYSVQTDPLVIRAVQNYAQQFSSSLYNEKTWYGLGRAWLASQGNTFDIIDISNMGAMPHAAFGFAEDYRFTVEAFESYLERLKPDGFLMINLFILPPPRTELRLIANIAAAAERLGIKTFPGHIAIVRSWDSLTLLIKKSALTKDDIKKIIRFARDKKFDLTYYPGIKPKESNVYIRMPGNEYFDAFQNLIDPKTRPQFIRDSVFDIQPIYDDGPFFHYHLKLENIRTIYRMMGEKWQYFIEEGYLLPILFVQLVFIAALLILLPLLNLKKNIAGCTIRTRLLTLVYFGSLGLGFMFVEVSYIQKMILFLGNPPYAMSTVIIGMLFGSGTGSLLSERITWLRNHWAVLALAAFIVLSSLCLPAIIHTMLKYSLPAKIALSLCIVLPPGFLMGIPFPLGLSHLGKQSPALIPWAWAMNGCCSVLAPVLAIMIALSAGFSMVIFAGAMFYLCAFLAFTLMKRKDVA